MPNLYNLTLHNETFQVISVPVNPKTAHVPPPPWQTPAHGAFLKNFGQILQYVGS